MNIPKDYDVVAKGAIDPAKGTDPDDNSGIKPSMSNIPETPGEKCTNDTAAESYNKKQPFGKGGSGYTSGT